MTTDFRALCAELLAALENEGYAHWTVPPDEDELCTEARAALAQPEPEGPTEAEIASIFLAYAVIKPQMGLSLILHEKHFGNAARAVLARWGRPTPQPADGEVAELVAWLRRSTGCADESPMDLRAASLLERLSPPQPIPASERLPGPGDLHPTDQWCWVCGQDCCAWHRVTRHFDAWSYWLPAHALPVPTSKEGGDAEQDEAQ